MSRYEWKTADGKTASIGWYDAMNTYFFMIHATESKDADIDEADSCELWIGDNFDEFVELNPLIERIPAGVEVPYGLHQWLIDDKNDNRNEIVQNRHYDLPTHIIKIA